MGWRGNERVVMNNKINGKTKRAPFFPVVLSGALCKLCQGVILLLNFECVIFQAPWPRTSLLYSNGDEKSVDLLKHLLHLRRIHLLLWKGAQNDTIFVFHCSSCSLSWTMTQKRSETTLEIITNVSRNDILREDIMAKLTQIFPIPFAHASESICDALFYLSTGLMTAVSINIRSSAALSRGDGICCAGEKANVRKTQCYPTRSH